MDLALLAALVLVAYLVGSIPVSYILTRWTTGVELQKVGTKNVGIANTFQHAPCWVGYISVLTDVLKVFTVLLAAQYWLGLGRDELYVLLAALIIGNVFPVFLRFRGSKARTITMWGLLWLAPLATAVLLVLWGFLFFVTKNSRIGVGVALAASPLLLFIVEGSWLIFGLAMALVVLLATQNREQRDDFKYAGVGR